MLLLAKPQENHYLLQNIFGGAGMSHSHPRVHPLENLEEFLVKEVPMIREWLL